MLKVYLKTITGTFQIQFHVQHFGLPHQNNIQAKAVTISFSKVLINFARRSADNTTRFQKEKKDYAFTSILVKPSLNSKQYQSLKLEKKI